MGVAIFSEPMPCHPRNPVSGNPGGHRIIPNITLLALPTSWDDVVRGTGPLEGIARYHPCLSIADLERMEIDTVTEALGLDLKQA